MRGDPEARLTRGRTNEDAALPATPSRSSMLACYLDLLTSIAQRVSTGRQRAIGTANQELLVTYWGIECDILDRQDEQGWEARVWTGSRRTLRAAFSDARGYPPQDLKYIRAFAEALTDCSIVQRSVARLPLAGLRDCARRPCTIAVVSPGRPGREALRPGATVLRRRGSSRVRMEPRHPCPPDRNQIPRALRQRDHQLHRPRCRRRTRTRLDSRPADRTCSTSRCTSQLLRGTSHCPPMWEVQT